MQRAYSTLWLDSNGLSPDEVKLSWAGTAIFQKMML
jgi:hypothetical protein